MRLNIDANRSTDDPCKRGGHGPRTAADVEQDHARRQEWDEESGRIAAPLLLKRRDREIVLHVAHKASEPLPACCDSMAA